MNEAEKICNEIQSALPNIRPGTLRFWGMWFGKPFDNERRLVACEHENGALRLRFHLDEQLSIWSPAGLELDNSELRINDADRVLWEWPEYGRPKDDRGFYFWDLVRTPKAIISNTNDTRYGVTLKTNHSSPAAELLTVPTFPRINAS